MAVNSPESTVTPQNQSESNAGTRIRNFLIALVAIALTVSLFLGFRTETPTGVLEALAAEATPLEVAISNGKPTLMEFYADWCTSCQAMAPDMVELKQQYGDKLNFVMLNVDNTKWLPEISRYRVDGIPDFVFMNNQGVAIAQSIGEQPRPVMTANLEALIAEQPLPYIQSAGQISPFQPPVTEKSSSEDPRSHGSQVQQ